MGHFGATVRSVVREWNTWVNGSVITTALLLLAAIVNLVALDHEVPKGILKAVDWAGVAWIVVTIPLSAIRVAHRATLEKISAENALAEEKSKKARPEIKGEIEEIDQLGLASTDSDGYYLANCWLWMHLVNAGASTTLHRWRVRARDKFGNEVKCSEPYSQATMPNRSGPPALSIHNLQNRPLETGGGAEVVICVQFSCSPMSIDRASLCVSFADVWDNEYAISASENMKVGYTSG
jgi:hypothetical protein